MKAARRSRHDGGGLSEGARRGCRVGGSRQAAHPLGRAGYPASRPLAAPRRGVSWCVMRAPPSKKTSQQRFTRASGGAPHAGVQVEVVRRPWSGISDACGQRQLTSRLTFLSLVIAQDCAISRRGSRVNLRHDGPRGHERPRRHELAARRRRWLVAYPTSRRPLTCGLTATRTECQATLPPPGEPRSHPISQAAAGTAAGAGPASTNRVSRLDAKIQTFEPRCAGRHQIARLTENDVVVARLPGSAMTIRWRGCRAGRRILQLGRLVDDLAAEVRGPYDNAEPERDERRIRRSLVLLDGRAHHVPRVVNCVSRLIAGEEGRINAEARRSGND